MLLEESLSSCINNKPLQDSVPVGVFLFNFLWSSRVLRAWEINCCLSGKLIALSLLPSLTVLISLVSDDAGVESDDFCNAYIQKFNYYPI